MRPFSWRDLPTLYRYRNQGIFLDSALMLTRGTTLIPGVIFSEYMTWVCKEECDEFPLIGQSYHPVDSPTARLSFIAPQEALQSPSAQLLLEQLARQTGKHGAFHLRAEAESDSKVFETLRKAGFSIYARQRVWRCDPRPAHIGTNEFRWRFTQPIDHLPVQSLYRQTVPDFVLSVEPLASIAHSGLVYSNNQEILAYAEIRYGGRGIWVRPVIKADLNSTDQLIDGLLRSIPETRSRPIYVCARAYQPHLEPALESLKAEPGPPQAAMVKHLAARHKLREKFALPNLEGRSEASAPLAQTRRNV